MYSIPRNFTIISFIGIFVVYLIGIIVPDIMEVDAAQYAAMSMEMAQTGSFLEVHHLGNNYLDKPPLIFWLGAISIKLFGINHIAYRLPNLLITFLGIFATYALGKKLYNKNTGIMSALILASSQIYFLHNHDVRTDTLLTNFVIVAIWQGYEYLESKKAVHFVLAFIAVGFAMLAKGPIGAVVPVMALGTHLVYKRDWKNLFNWRWLLGIGITLLVLTPMLWGLYHQFDANPDAIANGRTGVSGIRFFFWEQSFGRITGENVWKDDSSYFFFTHNYLWEFLPWSLLGLAALFSKFKNLISQKFSFSNSNEMLTIGGFLFPFIALSTSHYKLPHYIMVIMPMAAIFTAGYLDSVLSSENSKTRNVLSVIQWVLSIILAVFGVLIIYYVFPVNVSVWWLIPISVLIGGFVLFKNTNSTIRLMGPSLLGIVLINIIMNGYFYPSLNPYQSGRKLADWVVENEIRPDQLYLVNKHYFNIYFYSGANYVSTTATKVSEMKRDKVVYVFTNDLGVEQFTDLKVKFQIEKRLYNFPNAEMTPQFLNPDTREEALENFYILKLSPSI